MASETYKKIIKDGKGRVRTVHLLIQLLIQHHAGVIYVGVVVDETTAVRAQDGLGNTTGRRRNPVGPLTREGETLQVTCELLVVLAGGGATAGRHALRASGTREGLVARRQLRGMVDRWSVGNRLTLVRLPDGLGQHVRVYHTVGEVGGKGRRVVVAQHCVDTRRSRRRRDSEVLGLQGDGKQLSSLLLLQHAHLVLEHPALEGALTLVLHALEGALLFADRQQVSLRKSGWLGDGCRNNARQSFRTYYHRVSQPEREGTRSEIME